VATQARTVHRLKISLREVKPAVWRRIEVPSEMKLSKLAATLEAAMGWQGGHLHAFVVGRQRYGVPDPDWPSGELDERKVTVAEVLPFVKAKLRWEYDFGDGWEHDVVVEAIEPRQEKTRYPVCRAGQRACPPDDCGGPGGYEDLLEALADLNHPSHDELAEWVPPGFDPERFDLDETNAALRSPRPLPGW